MTTPFRDQLERQFAGTYALGRELAGGGMSHVFVADDNTLGRPVVIKVLRPELAEGLSAERFKREIRLAARLQHPHIVPLLAAGELPQDGSPPLLYYSMPLVDGESLRERLRREGSLPIPEAVTLLRNVASALMCAHRQHIVHRDIKPENILLSHGSAVVTDFGIAKAIQAAREDDGGDGARASTLTQRGTSLGTPAYMAPEQGAGDNVDHRADLYALGIVAYEMIAGRTPFEGRTTQQLLAAHATQAPEPLERRRQNVPQSLAAFVMQLLEKDPADRPQTADDVVRTLDAMSTGAAHALTPSARTASRAVWRHRLSDPVVLGLGLALAVVSIASVLLANSRSSREARTVRGRFLLELPANARINTDGPGSAIDLSPDGTRLVYVGGPDARLYIRHIDSLTPRALAGTELAANPRWSPDGRWIGFIGLTGVMKVPASGGPVRQVVAGGGRFTWVSNDTLVFTKSVSGFLSGLWRVHADGGPAEIVTMPNDSVGGIHGSPLTLPGGKAVVFTATNPGGDLILAALRLADRQVRSLGILGGGATYLHTGHLIFSRPDGSVAGVAFDAERLRVTSDPVLLLDSVAIKPGRVAQIAVAANGTMVYLPGRIGTQVAEADRQGQSRLVISAVDNYTNPRVSPDGRRIALSIGQPPYTSDIWVYDRTSATLTHLTSGGTNDAPEWSPDGKRIAWTSIARGREGVWWQPWDASAPPEMLVPRAGSAKFTPRGDAVIASVEVQRGTEVRLIPLPFDSAKTQRVLLPAATNERQHRLSADGTWLAYVSDESGEREVYVQPFPGPGGRYQVSVGGGISPVWGPANSQELFYIRNGCCLIAAKLVTSPDFRVVRRDTVTPVRGSSHPLLGSRRAYDVTPDGNHFLITQLATALGTPIIVFGWTEEVRQRIPSTRR